MSGVEEGLRSLSRIRPPDLWPDIEARQPRTSVPGPSPGHQLGVALVALAVAAAGVGLALRAFWESGGPASEGRRPVRNGPIWALGFSEGDAVTDIYAVDVETGSGPRLWADRPARYMPDYYVRPELVGTDYAFSPAGSRVAFSRHVGEGDESCCYEVFVMDWDGTDLAQVTRDEAYAAFPVWSPDGTEIVYTSYRGDRFAPGCMGTIQCQGDLYVIQTDGTGQRRLTDDPGDESMPTWSPEGARIVYTAAAEGSGRTLASVRADGSGQEAFPTVEGEVAFPRWSPDGSSLLFLVAEPGEPFALWVVDADGSSPHRVVDTEADTTFGPPAWAPDGRHIAYAQLALGQPQLWVVREDGSNPHELVETSPGYGLSPLAWQPIPDVPPPGIAPEHGSGGAEPRGKELWDRTFTSVVVTEGGRPRPLALGSEIRMTFEKREDGVAVGWSADCNSLGGNVRITSRRLLLIESLGGSEVGCHDALHQQDTWLALLFYSDPYWVFDGDGLTLASGETVIEFEPKVK